MSGRLPGPTRAPTGLRVAEVPPRERLVDDGDPVGAWLVAGRTHVALVKVASVDELHPERLDESRGDPHPEDGPVGDAPLAADDRW